MGSQHYQKEGGWVRPDPPPNKKKSRKVVDTDFLGLHFWARGFYPEASNGTWRIELDSCVWAVGVAVHTIWQECSRLDGELRSTKG